MSNITAAERDSFTLHGFFVRRDFFEPEAVALIHTLSNELAARAGDILETVGDGELALSEFARNFPDELIVVPEAADPRQVCRYEYILGANAQLKAFVRERIQPVISELMAEPYIPFKDKCNEKNPGGGGFPPHQDFAAYGAFPPAYNVTAIIGIDAMTKENGCVQFATNFRALAGQRPDFVRSETKRLPLFHYHNGGPKNGDILEEIVDDLIWEAVPSKPSDLILFDSFVPHYSEPNLSAGPRRAMFMTFNAAREGDWYDHYYAEKRMNYADPKFHVSTPTKHNAL